MQNESYQSFQPDWTSPPGDTISDLLETRGIVRSRFALLMQLSIEQANALIRGALPIDETIATRLVLLFQSLSVDFWLAREKHYVLDLKRLKLDRPR